MIVRIWQAQAEYGELEEVLDWLRSEVVPAALAAPGCLGAEAFVAEGGEDSVVVLTRWQDARAEDWEEGSPSRRMLRGEQSWWYRPLDRQLDRPHDPG